MSYAILKNRTFIELGGSDRVTFLEALVSNSIKKIALGEACYTCLLTPQGKYLHDFFVYNKGDVLLLECSKDDMQTLGVELRNYKLHADIYLKPAAPYFFYTSEKKIKNAISYKDTRHHDLGYRNAFTQKIDSVTQYDHSEFLLLKNALPYKEILQEKCFLIHYNFQYIQAIDFQKGCYVGQEVTARMYYRDLAKYCLVSFYAEQKNIWNKRDILFNQQQENVGTCVDFFDHFGLFYCKRKYLDENMKYYLNAHENVAISVLKMHKSEI